MVYVTTARGQVVALDAASGTERWRSNVSVNITAAPTVAGSAVLIGTESGVVFGLDAHTGERLWESRQGEDAGSPIVAGSTMYVVS
jgi:outer membrane protein assembly factor BamB